MKDIPLKLCEIFTTEADQSKFQRTFQRLQYPLHQIIPIFQQMLQTLQSHNFVDAAHHLHYRANTKYVTF